MEIEVEEVFNPYMFWRTHINGLYYGKDLERVYSFLERKKYNAAHHEIDPNLSWMLGILFRLNLTGED